MTQIQSLTILPPFPSVPGYPTTNPVEAPLQLQFSAWPLCKPAPYAPCLPIKNTPPYQTLSQPNPFHLTNSETDVAPDQGLPAPALSALAYFVFWLNSTSVGLLGTF